MKKTPLIIAGIGFAVLTGGIIAIVVRDVINGWSGAKTVSYSFVLCYFICGLSTCFSLHSFAISNNSKMIRANNVLFQLLEEAEKEGLLDTFKCLKNNQSREKALMKINNFLLEKCPSASPLAHGEISSFMERKTFLEEPISLCSDDVVELLFLYNKYEATFSKSYETIFADYKSREMLRRQPFPLFTFILPFITGFIGFFALIFQDVNAAEPQKDGLFTYIIVFLGLMLIGVIYWFWSFSSFVPLEVEKKETLAQEVRSILNLRYGGKPTVLDTDEPATTPKNEEKETQPDDCSPEDREESLETSLEDKTPSENKETKE